jgi:hypothetical protein
MPHPPLSEKLVLEHLAKQTKAQLLEYLAAAYKAMKPAQRSLVFAEIERSLPKKSSPAARVDPRRLSRELQRFQRESYAKKYYAPFNMDSKNYMHVPAETSAWCDRFAQLAKQACELTKQGDHVQAVRCFGILFELLQAMESGDHDIVFAHELGGWMIPFDDKVWLKAYMKSLAATADPAEFARQVIPLLEFDSTQSFSAEVHSAAIALSTPGQRAAMETERVRRGVRAPGEPRRYNK